MFKEIVGNCVILVQIVKDNDFGADLIVDFFPLVGVLVVILDGAQRGGDGVAAAPGLQKQLVLALVQYTLFNEQGTFSIRRHFTGQRHVALQVPLGEVFRRGIAVSVQQRLS